MTICTIFAGYEGPYLDRWMKQYDLMGEGIGCDAFWLDNSGDGAFRDKLRGYIGDMSFRVDLAVDSFRLMDVTTGPGKNVQVCYLWKQVVNQRSGPLLLVESDVLVPIGGPEQLHDELARHPDLGAISGAVPEHRGEVGTMAWKLREVREEPYAPPMYLQGVSWYNPERTSGVELVEGVPFGCLAVMSETFLRVPMCASMFPRFGHDQEWSINAWKAGRPVAIDWGVHCGHFKPDFDPGYDDMRSRMTTMEVRELGCA